MIYMEDTLKQITEAWEGILLEMDNKLEAYASKLPDATDARTATVAMAADFLDLLTFGTPSPDLESFLLQVQFTKHFFLHTTCVPRNICAYRLTFYIKLLLKTFTHVLVFEQMVLVLGTFFFRGW